ncbi:MAG TPA: 7-cyano-7-deazaguanine synthase QueC [Planctomycetaceae bacterium]|nr:7-cyano-7-deazaguanine synthase QueC [Planctomycetaceae bacterium]
MTVDRKRAVVLLSGGLDSATTLAIARSEGFDCFAISFDYGQRHRHELESAAKVAQAGGVREHLVYRLDASSFAGSALTGGVDVPKDRNEAELASGIPVTYVPARNTVFLSVALGWSEIVEACDLYVGVNAVDYSGYPDCRPEYIQAFERLANLATKVGVEQGAPYRIHAPLISLTKSEIIERGTDLGVDYSLTHSCYDPNVEGLSCGHCDSCTLRLKGFAEAGLIDPISYRD